MAAPTLSSAAINTAGTTLTLTFDQTISLVVDGGIPTVTIGTRIVNQAVTGLAATGSNANATMTVPQVYAGETVTVTVPVGTVQNGSLQNNSLITAHAVTNGSTTNPTAPGAPSLTIQKDGRTLDFVFEGYVAAGTGNPTIDVSGRLTGKVATVVNVKSVVMRARLLTGAVYAGETVTCDFAAGLVVDNITGASGNSLASGITVTNNSLVEAPNSAARLSRLQRN